MDWCGSGLLVAWALLSLRLGDLALVLIVITLQGETVIGVAIGVLAGFLTRDRHTGSVSTGTS